MAVTGEQTSMGGGTGRAGGVGTPGVSGGFGGGMSANYGGSPRDAYGGDGGDRFGGINLQNLLRRLASRQQQQQQQPFQFMQPQGQSFMPQIAPPSFMGAPPMNVQDLYAMYGAGPQGVMPGSVQQPSPPTQQPPMMTNPVQPGPYPSLSLPGGDWLSNRRF